MEEQIPANVAALLSEYDMIVVLDKSGSMTETDCPRGMSRWASAEETIGAIARDFAKFDTDGIDVVTFGANVEKFTGVTPDKVTEIFSTTSPRGSTPLAQALTAALELAGKSEKKDFILVLTDGIPDDAEAARQVILNQANSQANDDDLTILFVQVGRNADATKYLQSLDDQLTGAKWDIVDTKTIAEVEQFANTTDMIVAAING